MEFSAKLKQLRKARKITQEQLAKMINVERSSVGKYETGVLPSMEVLRRISTVFDVSVDYLIGQEPVGAPRVPGNLLPLETKKVPLLGRIACGQPIFASEEHGEFIVASDTLDADFCLRAQGDSMVGARILDGDVVFIRRQDTVENGQIAAVLIGDEATLKRVYYYPESEKLILTPENPAYEPLVYMGEELGEIRIIGRAVAFQSVIR